MEESERQYMSINESDQSRYSSDNSSTATTESPDLDYPFIEFISNAGKNIQSDCQMWAMMESDMQEEYSDENNGGLSDQINQHDFRTGKN